MYPVDSPAHEYLAVQIVVVLHFVLALVITVAMAWLGVPIEWALPVFVIAGMALLLPFYPLYVKYHPTNE